MLRSVEPCFTNDLINYGSVGSLEVSSRYNSSIASQQRRNKNFRFDRRDSRLSEVSSDRGNEVRRARDYVTAPSRIGCPLVSPEKEPAGRLPRVLLPLKLIRSLYVYRLLKFMRQFSCVMREISCITESVPKPSDVLSMADFLKSEFDLFSQRKSLSSQFLTSRAFFESQKTVKYGGIKYA